MTEQPTNQYLENEKPEEIRANIQQKRQDMSRKIDAIQDRLDPQNLKAQAQEAMYGAVNDSADAIVTYVRENSGDLSKSLVSTLKRNPVPAVLVGLGMGWMLLESLSNSDNGARSYKAQQPKDRWDPYRAGNGGYGSYSRDRYSLDREDEGSWMESAKERAASVAHAVQDSASSVQSSITQKVKETANQVSETVNQKLNSARDIADQAQQSLYDRTQETPGYGQYDPQRMRYQSGDAGQQGSNQMEGWRQEVNDQTAHLSERAQRQAQQAGVQVQRHLNDHPLPYGAVAFAIGAAIGLALPATRKENEWLGETRDQLWRSAQDVADDVVDRTQRVIEEVKPELQATAEKAVNDIKQAGQQAVSDRQNSGQHAEGTLKEVGREAADGIRQTLDKAEKKVRTEADKVERKVNTEADKVAQTVQRETPK